MPVDRTPAATTALVALALALLVIGAACGGGPGDPTPAVFADPGLAATDPAGPSPSTTSEPDQAAIQAPDGESTAGPSVRSTPGPMATQPPSPAVVPSAVLASTATPRPEHTLSQAEREEIAVRFIEAVVAGDFNAAEIDFDDVVRVGLPPDDLAALWDQLTGRVGDFISLDGLTESDQRPHKLLVVETLFQTFFVNFRFTIDYDGRIVGLYFGPDRPSEGFPAPDYADEDAFIEVGVAVGQNGDWPLPGTLTLPVGPGPFPAVVLVHGSGPADRDETVGLIKPFRDLAWGLASRGVAVLRYDKRTFAHGDRLIASGDPFTLSDETVDDAVAAVEWLLTIERIDPGRVFVLGHGLGGYAIPRIAARTGQSAGYVMLAGAARPIPELAVEQIEYVASLDGKIFPDERAAIDGAQATADAIEALRPGDDSTEPLFGERPEYWLDLRDYDPAEEARGIAAPMLVLQGAVGYQVTVRDYKLWRDALGDRPNVEFKLYPGLNHFFIEVDGKSTPDDVLRSAHVAQQVVDDIADWVNRR